MIALGQIIGMIHLSKEDSLAELRKKEATLKSLSEQVAMTLSNLQLRESLRSQAIRDPLTGLFNRRYLEETLERELSRSERKGRPLSLIMMDLDHFKRFNDSYGHAAGDELLKSFGKVLSQRARKDDVACRYGGEEFLLILPECTIDNAETVAETIRKDAMTLWIQTDPAQPVVSISAGISCYPEHGDSSKGLMLTADRALYEAKSAGRNCVIKSSSVTR